MQERRACRLRGVTRLVPTTRAHTYMGVMADWHADADAYTHFFRTAARRKSARQQDGAKGQADGLAHETGFLKG